MARSLVRGPVPAFLSAFLSAVLLLALPAAAAFPERPITLSLGFSAGGSSDVTARAFGPYMEKYLPPGAKIVIENKPGGDGVNMYRALAREKPDGYNLGLLVSPNAIAVLHEGKNLRYDLDSFDYIGQIIKDYTTLTVAKDSRFKTLGEMIEWGRQNPRGITVGLTGFSGAFVAIRSMFQLAKVEVTYVPFGGGELSTALLGGHITASGVNLASAGAYKDVQRILVVFAEERLAGLKDIPTVRENGYDVVGVTTRGIVAPKGLPADVREILVKAVAQASQDPGYHEYLRKGGLLPGYLDPDAYAAYIRAVYKQHGEIWARDPWIRTGK